MEPARAAAVLSAEAAPVADGPLVPAFFADRTVLVTGATGFLGKVVVERLLATCPDVERVFLLVRLKRDLAPERRLQLLKGSEVFAGLRARCPARLDKLRVVAGDTARPLLGLTPDDLRELRAVSVVLHSAVTVKFNAPLQTAVDDNVRSAMAMLAVADRLPALDVLVHVSTAYCNTEGSHVEERVYEQRMRTDQALAATLLPEELQASITDRLIAPKANTYLFTKAVAESVVAAHAPRRYAIAIFRPTIVTSSYRFPVPGWTDSAAGPMGSTVAYGKGVLRAVYVRSAARADLVPVDIVADTMLCTAWDAHHTASDVKVYNCSSMENQPTWGESCDAAFKYTRQYPFDKALWYPFAFITGHRCLYKTLEAVFQTTPLYALEVIQRLRGVKAHPSPAALATQLSSVADALAFVTLREWQFDVGNVRAMRSRLTRADRDLYNVDVKVVCWDELFRDIAKGARKYLLKEKDEDIPAAKRHMARLRVLHYSAVAALFALLVHFPFRFCMALLTSRRTRRWR